MLMIPNYLPLRDYQIEENFHILDLGAGTQFKRLRLDGKSFDVLKRFLSANTPQRVARETNIPIEGVVDFCRSLEKEGILIHYRSPETHFERYSRHLQYFGLNQLDPNTSQQRLSDLKITLIGVGGIGNWVGLNLLGLGIKKLRLVDHDVIEESNLPRQVLFNETDIGKLKTDAAEREFLRRNKELDVEKICEEVSENNVLDLVAGSDFVVLSADKPFFKIQKWVNKACLEKGVPLLNVGYAEGEGIMGPMVLPGNYPCLACNGHLDGGNFHLKESKTKNPFDEHFIAPSFVCLNSLISSLASYEIVKYFLDFGQCVTINHTITIDPLNFSIETELIRKNKKCLACSQTH